MKQESAVLDDMLLPNAWALKISQTHIHALDVLPRYGLIKCQGKSSYSRVHDRKTIGVQTLPFKHQTKRWFAWQNKTILFTIWRKHTPARQYTTSYKLLWPPTVSLEQEKWKMEIAPSEKTNIQKFTKVKQSMYKRCLSCIRLNLFTNDAWHTHTQKHRYTLSD